MPGMVTRIGPKTPRQHYLAKWRMKRQLTQQQLADRLDTYKGQISNWENDNRKLGAEAIAALEEALELSPGQLFHDPDRPSADELLRDQPAELRKQAIELIQVLIANRA